MANKIILPVILSSYRPRNDGSWSITLSTNILTSEQKQVIDSMHQQLCCIMIKDSDVIADEIEIFDTIELDIVDARLTPSKRLQNVFYRLWEKTKDGEFKEFYRVKMEQLIEHFKKKLD